VNRGSDDGLDRGTVLTIEASSQSADDHCASIDGTSTCFLSHSTKLPAETAGTMLVFKTYERMSYALILSDTVPIHLQDRVRNP